MHYSRHFRKGSALRRGFSYAGTALAIGTLIMLVIATFLPAQLAANSGTLPSAKRIARLGPQAQGGGQNDLTSVAATKGDQNQAGGEVIEGPFKSEPVYPVKRDIDLRELPQVGPTIKDQLLPELELPGRETDGAANLGSPFADPVAQTSVGPIDMPSPLQGFAGLDQASWGAGWPPDTNGDVGPVYYIQTVNTSIGIYNKATGARVAAFTFDTFFDGTGTPCDADNNGDPIVLYDTQADRWIITDFAWSNLQNGPYYECIAVSQTGDPVSGGWYQYAYVAHNAYLADYPKLGVWPDGYYMSMNLFDCLNSTCSSATWQGVRVYAFNRANLLAGQPLTAITFDLSAASNYGALLPSNLRGAQPPTGSPNYFLSADQDWSGANDVIHLWRFHVDWNTPANSTFTGPTDLVTAAFAWPAGTVPAQGGMGLDTLGDRVMMQLQYRNIGGTESLWVNHTVSSGGVTGIRWYELRSPNTTPVIYQQGTYQPDTTYRWMGSIAVDRVGNAALGYSASSATMYPAIRYTGRLVTDTLGQMPQGEATLIAGTGSQTSYSRWGDYSAMTVDPVDDCTFWYTTEYYATTGTNWQTRIGSFRFPECLAQSGNLTGTVTNLNTSAPINNANVQIVHATGGIWNATTDVNGRFQFVNIPTGIYTATASATNYMPSTVVGINVATGLTTTQNFALVPLPQANLIITKTASASAVSFGAPLTYTLAVDNLGPDAAPSVITVTDVLPAGVTFVSASGTGWTCTGTATVVCTRASLAVGSAPVIIIRVNAPASAGVIANTATVTSLVTDPVPANNTSSVGVTVAAQTDLTITKNGPAAANINSTLVYTLNVTNNGPLAIGVLVTQTYANAAGITINSSGAASLYPSPVTVSGLGNVVTASARLINFSHTWPEDVDVLLTAPGGQRTLLMSDPRGGATAATNLNLAFADSGAAMLCTNGALASGLYHPTDCPNDYGDDTFPAPAPAGPYTAAMSDFVGGSANGTWNLFVRDDFAGDAGSISGGWALTLTTSYAGPVTVTDTLPAGTTYVGATGSGWVCSQALGIVTCTRSSLAVGAAPGILITVTAPSTAGVITNTANVSSLWPDDAPGNNSAALTTTIVDPFAIVYAHPSDATCGGNSPCYSGGTAVQQALNAVSTNGLVVVLSAHTANASLTCANNVTVSGASGASVTWTGAAGSLFTALNCNLQVKGLALNGGSTATIFNQAGTGTITAYANNISNYAAAFTGSGTHNLGHNYWGTSDPLAAAPSGFSAAEWAARLGAPLANWAEGSGSATLITGGHTAALNGGSGTAVIVSHGRGQANAPFGNGVAPYVNQTCSDFYDLFTVNGGGTWTAQIPVDNTANCNTNTLTPRRVGWITTLAQCSPATNGACWNALDLVRVSISGQNLLIANLTVAELGGTPFVAGDVNGDDPTAVQLTRIEAHATSWTPLLAIAALAGLSVGLVMLRRRRA